MITVVYTSLFPFASPGADELRLTIPPPFFGYVRYLTLDAAADW